MFIGFVFESFISSVLIVFKTCIKIKYRLVILKLQQFLKYLFYCLLFKSLISKKDFKNNVLQLKITINYI